ncbi:MAG: hypothetical protein WC305_02130 [Bacteroidales bacterium]|jgi:hypothetical protein
MKKDEIKKILDNYYEEVKVPEGLKERLISTIDQLAQQEVVSSSTTKHKKIIFRPVLWRALAAAAVVALIVIFSINIPSDKNNNIFIADTYTDVNEAYRETTKALLYISASFNKGIDKVNESSETIAKSTTVVNKHIQLK